MRLASSGDWSNAVENAYGTDSSGLGAFVSLQAGVPIGLADNFIVKPKVSASFGAVSADVIGGEDDSYVDTFVIPGVAAEYYVSGYKDDSIFIGAEVGAVSASGGSDKYSPYGYDLAGDGVSFGIYGGYAFGGGARVSIGYRSIPVEVTYHPDTSYEYKESENFGGVSFLFSYAFMILRSSAGGLAGKIHKRSSDEKEVLFSCS